MEQKSTTCADEAVLLWYAAEALSGEDARRVAAHVQGCLACQEKLAEVNELTELYRSLPIDQEAHLTPAEISRLVEEGLETSALAGAREHLAACAECSEIAEVVKKVDRDLAGERIGARLWTAARARWEGFSLPAWTRSPVPAYLLVLLMLYPAYQGAFRAEHLRQRVDELERPILLSATRSLESEGERAARPGEVSVEQTASHAVLTFFVAVEPGAHRYQVELRDESGTTLFTDPDARSFDELGTFALLVPRGALPAGEYHLRLEEREREGGRVVNVFSFPFSIAAPSGGEAR